MRRERKGSLQHPDCYIISPTGGACMCVCMHAGCFKELLELIPKEHLESYLTPVCPALVYAASIFSFGEK